MPKLSAYLIVKNEARDLPACLDSLRGLADELVVVDDESTDKLPRRCAGNVGARLFSRKLDEVWDAERAYAPGARCTGDWALSIDADERVTPELAKEIQAVLTQSEGPDGYRISRKMYFLGKRLRFGGVPVGKDWVLRLFRREKGRLSSARNSLNKST